VWRFTKGINRQMPLSPGRYGRQTEINRINACIEHEAYCALLIFMDQTGEVFVTVHGFRRIALST
jgi:hypothetical protein